MISLKYILLLTLLFVLVINQGGGGSKRSSSSSSRSRSSRSYSSYSTSKETIQECQNQCYKEKSSTDTQKNDCLQKCDQEHLSTKQLLAKCENRCYKNEYFDDPERNQCLENCKKENQSSSIGTYILIGMFGFFIIGGVISGKNEMKIQRQMKQAFTKEHSQNIKQFEANESEIEQLAQSFVSKKLQVTLFQQKNIYTTQPFTITLSRKDKFLFNIKFSTSDFFGKATYEGYLSFSSKGQKLWMMKNYQDKQKAGQTGNWKYLIYESEIVNNSITNGRWYYKGFEGDSKYSGSWKMQTLKGQ